MQLLCWIWGFIKVVKGEYKCTTIKYGYDGKDIRLWKDLKFQLRILKFIDVEGEGVLELQEYSNYKEDIC